MQDSRTFKKELAHHNGYIISAEILCEILYSFHVYSRNATKGVHAMHKKWDISKPLDHYITNAFKVKVI